MKQLWMATLAFILFALAGCSSRTGQQNSDQVGGSEQMATLEAFLSAFNDDGHCASPYPSLDRMRSGVTAQLIERLTVENEFGPHRGPALWHLRGGGNGADWLRLASISKVGNNKYIGVWEYGVGRPGEGETMTDTIEYVLAREDGLWKIDSCRAR